MKFTNINLAYFGANNEFSKVIINEDTKEVIALGKVEKMPKIINALYKKTTGEQSRNYRLAEFILSQDFGLTTYRLDELPEGEYFLSASVTMEYLG